VAVREEPLDFAERAVGDRPEVRLGRFGRHHGSSPPTDDRPAIRLPGISGIRFTLDTLETRRMVIRYTLRKIANGRPLSFWLDDLHNAGPATVNGLLRILAPSLVVSFCSSSTRPCTQSLEFTHSATVSRRSRSGAG
jgi:hypothetical protein